jgi:uncharacterized protein YggT (Ycf19 family)
MGEQIQQVRKVSSGGITTRTTKVTDDAPQAITNERSNTIVRIVWFVVGILLVLLAFRFVFILLGANPNNGFANFIYSVSYPFAAPFFGLFGYTLKYGISRVELSTLVAMVVYALIAFGITTLLTIGHPNPDD